mmetsp:Transcript_1796/g.2735  ORF Transcript_1796/g.2735 Transcript_1796/m.2735 type:complete len:81 (-) Transcript_1796:795-1037(-)
MPMPLGKVIKDREERATYPSTKIHPKKPILSIDMVVLVYQTTQPINKSKTQSHHKNKNFYPEKEQSSSQTHPHPIAKNAT